MRIDMESTAVSHLPYANLSLTNDHFSGNETLMYELIRQYSLNKKIEEPYHSFLIILYSLLIIIGSCGNVLVILAVLRNKSMQTARNIFIVNLAISDLLLCLVTSPLTLIEILSKFWPYGDSLLICKSIGMLQGISIFVSTISITAIALDRYHLIVGCPAKDNLQILGAIAILLVIWIIAFLCALPLYLYKNIFHIPFNLSKLNINNIYFCVEDWPELQFLTGRIFYSIFSLALQYFIPILVVSFAYNRIYFRLKKRIIVTQTVPSVDERIQERRGRRTKRTNFLLISIALIFGISWLPLNIFNLSTDIYYHIYGEQKTTREMYMIYAVCHIVGMSSACSNPLLYGWLNSNFKKEFKEILCCKMTGNETSSSLRKVKGLESSFAAQINRRSGGAKDNECNGDTKLKAELLRPNGTNEEAQEEYTMTTNI